MSWKRKQLHTLKLKRPKYANLEPWKLARLLINKPFYKCHCTWCEAGKLRQRRKLRDVLSDNLSELIEQELEEDEKGTDSICL